MTNITKHESNILQKNTQDYTVHQIKQRQVGYLTCCFSWADFNLVLPLHNSHLRQSHAYNRRDAGGVTALALLSIRRVCQHIRAPYPSRDGLFERNTAYVPRSSQNRL